MNRLNITESAVFLFCRFSLFLKDPFFQIILKPQVALSAVHLKEVVVLVWVHCFLLPLFVEDLCLVLVL